MLWSGADAFLSQGVSFLIGIILARLLSPDEYGLIGICLIFNVVLNGIVDSGFSTSLIRKKEIDSIDYSTMFYTNMGISIFLYLILFCISPLVADFFSRPQLTELIRVTGLVLIINALSIVQVTVLTKRLDFKTKTKASLFAAVSSGLIGILMAYMGYGVWALVGQHLLKQILFTAVLWFCNRWYPMWAFSKTSFDYMWGFGWKLLLSGLLNNAWNQLYQLVVGKFYSPATLGQYTRSKEYAGIFSSNLTLIIQRVSYPVLSELQDDQQKMLSAYRKVIRMTMFVTTVCMISLAAVSEPLILSLIGPKWYEASTYLPLICISMSLYPLHAINLSILQVMGRSDIFLYLEIIKKVFSIIPILVGVYVGIYSMLCASIIIGVVNLYVNSWYTGKKLGYTFFRQLLDIAPFYALSFIVAIAVYFLKYLPLEEWVILSFQLVLGCFVFILLCELSKMSEYVELKNILFRKL